MNRVEAKWLLLRELVRWQRRPYHELQSMLDKEQHHELRGASGCEYQIEVEPVWDDRPDGDIRILGSIDDGKHRAYCPLSYGTLVRKPDAV
jgi:hypothetical protein